MPGNGHDNAFKHRAARYLVGIVHRTREAVEKLASSHDGLRRYVGTASGIGSIILAVLNVVYLASNRTEPLVNVLLSYPVILLVVIGAGWLVTGVGRRTFLAWIQVGVFYSASIAVAAGSHPGNVTSAIFLILAVILGTEYKQRTKFLAIGVPAMIAVYALTLMHGYRIYTKDWLLSTVAALILVLLLLALYGGIILRHRLQHRREAELLESRVRERTKELEKALGERVVMLQEIHHRVKNNLQIVASLLHLEANKLSDDESRRPMETSIQRIHAMALVHETLYQSEELQHVELGQYTRELIAAVASSVGPAITLSVDVDAVIEVDLDFAVPFGLLLNELVTNSVEHAFDPDGTGTISVSLHRNASVELIIEDDGVGLPQETADGLKLSLGLTIVHSLVKQLGGRIDVETASGTRWLVTIPNEGPHGVGAAATQRQF